MGFLGGLITGLGVAAAAAAWYMSRGGEKVREQYRLEERLGELGNEIDARTKDLQATVNTQIAELRSKTNGHDADEALDDVTAGAAEAAADAAAGVESAAGKAKKAAKDVAEDAS